MTRPARAIRNIGPSMESQFARAGLVTAEEIIALGADAAYLRLIAAGMRPHFIGYYALVLGLQGRPWTDIDPGEKAVLRTRFDALREQGSAARVDEGLSRLEAALDRIGVFPDQPTSSRPEKK